MGSVILVYTFRHYLAIGCVEFCSHNFHFQQLSKKEVEELLRKGAYGAIMDESNEGDKFSEEDIDTILQRRTQTITIDAGVKGSTFAKVGWTDTVGSWQSGL